MQKKFVVVADDFTGANDTGVQFKKVGLKVKVVIDTSALSKEIEQYDVIVIDLESRLVPAEEAYNRSLLVGKKLGNIGDCIVYKKLDSTFRGNIGAEIDGLMEGMQLKMTLLAPALPMYGRTIENGEVYVHKVKLADTEVSRDPRTPVKLSRITDIIGIQSKRICKEISTNFFTSARNETKELFLTEISDGSEIIIFDSSDEKDLENIADLVDSIYCPSFLLAGTAGLANYLVKTSLFSKKLLAFVFAGSISEKTREQIMHSVEEGNCKLIFIDGEKLLDGGFKTDQIIAMVSESFANGNRRFIFTSAVKPEDVRRVYQIAKQKDLSQDEAAGKISFEMGQLAATLIKEFKPSGVLLTGGETAINTVKALSATGIEIDQEILPGVQSGTLTGCAISTVIATKAGGFGEPDAISKTFQFFKV